MTNLDLSLQVFEFLKASQVKSVVVCAGARNAPLIMALQKQNFKIYSYFEERSAAFFALGLIRSTGNPVAVITTSGTAVAELLPAAIEATYQSLPLILITADRPKNYRRTGAPQAIEQVGIFSSYVESVYDLDVDSRDFNFRWSVEKPIQINVCFDEPLIDAPSKHQNKKSSLIKVNYVKPKPIGQLKAKDPLVIAGSLSIAQVSDVVEFILKNQLTVYAESTSQLRSVIELKPYLIQSTDYLVNHAFTGHIFNSVIRIGGVPTLRFWRDLENDFKDIPVKHFSDSKFSGLARASELYSLANLKDVIVDQAKSNAQLLTLDRNLNPKKADLFKKYPLSEPAFVARLGQIVA
ncbi:MAG: 2-succinyl-5-enolpyruvyl-6-hydroxy-3-cyclohexene-1-carboxylate synthase, partial [Bdellovibrionaceae bacterium]|nr:2-succinyl-5-enolpyruvyl-6-hydroxy-3-cyclohexene-1-carboxylate synthase [Bdellovibrio sp.]